MSGVFSILFNIQPAITGCPDRICFEVNITDTSKWRAIGLSLSGTSMGDFEKLVVGRVATTPYVYHKGPGDGRTNPSSGLITGDPCLSSIELGTCAPYYFYCITHFIFSMS